LIFEKKSVRACRFYYTIPASTSSANDTLHKTLIFNQLKSQPEPVEGGIFFKQRVRQAHPDIVI
jgi:hypothetical protein